MIRPRYPVYVPSKGRHEHPSTIRFLQRDSVPFWLVVEREERELYAPLVDPDRLLVLPESEQGLIYARNWIKQHSIDAGFERHWQLDDNIRRVVRLQRGKRVACASGPALAAVEDFVDRYENVAIAGLNYRGFIRTPDRPPFYLNQRVYSCSLVLNEIPYRWRLRYNDDTDICLQALAGGWCTVLVNVFLIDKLVTMSVPGGNTDDLYRGDGRLTMARALERQWPHVVRVDRRFGRPQHVVRAQWRKFDTPLKRRAGIDPAKLAANEYGLRLVQSKL